MSVFCMIYSPFSWEIRVQAVTTLYPNFELVSFSNNGVIRVLCCCYGNEHRDLHILELIIKKCFTRYLRLKCINNEYLCQKQRYEGFLKTNSKFQICTLLRRSQEQNGPNS